MALNIRQQRFCEEYVTNGGIGLRAALAAGYAETSARITATNLLKDAEILLYIEEIRTQAITDGGISRTMLIQELKGVAFSNVTDYLEISGSGVDIKDINALPRHQQIAIAEIAEQSNEFGGSNVKLKLHPKLDAIGKLLKMIGADGPIEGGATPAGNTLEEGNFVLKRRKRSKENDSTI